MSCCVKSGEVVLNRQLSLQGLQFAGDRAVGLLAVDFENDATDYGRVGDELGIDFGSLSTCGFEFVGYQIYEFGFLIGRELTGRGDLGSADVVILLVERLEDEQDLAGVGYSLFLDEESEEMERLGRDGVFERSLKESLFFGGFPKWRVEEFCASGLCASACRTVLASL